MKITSGNELDWNMALNAVKNIVKQCEDSFYTPPEAVGDHQRRIREVCTAMDAIVDALRLQRANGSKDRVKP